MSQKITLQEIDSMRGQILNMLQFLETQKRRIHTHDHSQLTNHLGFTLRTLDNMINVSKVEMTDPYSTHASAQSHTQSHTVVYNSDGSTRLVDTKQFRATGDGWENQFDESLLMKPPCFLIPPQQVTHIPAIQKAGSADIMRRL